MCAVFAKCTLSFVSTLNQICIKFALTEKTDQVLGKFLLVRIISDMQLWLEILFCVTKQNAVTFYKHKQFYIWHNLTNTKSQTAAPLSSSDIQL